MRHASSLSATHWRTIEPAASRARHACRALDTGWSVTSSVAPQTTAEDGRAWGIGSVTDLFASSFPLGALHLWAATLARQARSLSRRETRAYTPRSLPLWPGEVGAKLPYEASHHLLSVAGSMARVGTSRGVPPLARRRQRRRKYYLQVGTSREHAMCGSPPFCYECPRRVLWRPTAPTREILATQAC